MVMVSSWSIKDSAETLELTTVSCGRDLGLD